MSFKIISFFYSCTAIDVPIYMIYTTVVALYQRLSLLRGRFTENLNKTDFAQVAFGKGVVSVS